MAGESTPDDGRTVMPQRLAQSQRDVPEDASHGCDVSHHNGFNRALLLQLLEV